MINNIQEYDVIIVGAGASGLMAAVSCKKKNRALRVAVLEKNSKIGKKLLATGNGRCNLTNVCLSKWNYHGSFNPEAVIEKITPDRLIKQFWELGLLCRAETGGLVYPYCKQSSAVLETLEIQCNRREIDIYCDCTVTLIKKSGDTFKLRTELGNFSCKKVILCTGGKASPACGGTGAGLDLLRNLGHTITPLSPALCPVETDKKILKGLKGVRTGAKVALYDGNRFVKEDSGELQFTENALSGICVFNLSTEIKDLKKPVIEVSLMNEYSNEETFDLLCQKRKICLNLNAEYLLAGVLNNKIAASLFKESGIDLNKKCGELTDFELKALVKLIKCRRFECKKPVDFSRAQVTAGGVAGNEINPKTLESRLVKNLFICGEALDIYGDCGGYNLHFAFASGIIAGESI